ncbi:hypothetical protein SAZ11_13475 [Streptomyces sp. FXJ1.4098]|nr:hypothetical protein [Streptomyces sp. FXJ1.4098]
MAKIYAAGLLRSEPAGLVEVVRGESANAARLEELYAQAEHEVCLIDSPPYLARSPPVGPPERSAAPRCRVPRALLRRIPGVPDLLAYAEGMVALGEQARVLPTVP